ncbi:MAG: alpha/beta hydrolase, partial [Actinomycetota bacterium]|nr:alpha/beta hydrolase [Actinomycetota bacterium]
MIPAVADALVRVFAATVDTTARAAVRFPDIPGDTTPVTIPTRHGDAPATVYRPPAGTPHPPVYVNVHGGGFAVGHPEQDDPWCRYLAANAGVVVINPDYVLAPRRRFPAAPQQIYDIVCWAAGGGHDWDGARLCVGGQSAGGNLSAAAARLALDNGGPRIALQVLHYAPLDLVTSTWDKPSPLGLRAVLTPWMGEAFDTAYIPDRSRRRDPLASPAWADNTAGIGGIAPALIIAAEYDRLRDEAHRYATALEAVGALAGYHVVRGADHGYNLHSDTSASTVATYARIVDHVLRATSA